MMKGPWMKVIVAVGGRELKFGRVIERKCAHCHNVTCMAVRVQFRNGRIRLFQQCQLVPYTVEDSVVTIVERNARPETGCVILATIVTLLGLLLIPPAAASMMSRGTAVRTGHHSRVVRYADVKRRRYRVVRRCAGAPCGDVRFSFTTGVRSTPSRLTAGANASESAVYAPAASCGRPDRGYDYCRSRILGRNIACRSSSQLTSRQLARTYSSTQLLL